MRRLMTLPILGVLVFGLMLTAQADHPPTSDFGADEAWTNDMNQEAYWETRWDAECTKYEGHGGQIPASIDAAVVKSGSSFVHVYSDLTDVGAFTAIGPPNPNAQHPNRRHTAPYSWVMKCSVNETTTTTTPEEESTTTLPEQESTTTIPEETTTTPSTTTTPGDTTTVGLIDTWFDATSECQSDGGFTLTVEFGEGMESALVSLYDPMFPDPVEGADIVLTPANPSTHGSLGAAGAFIVTGTPSEGYEITSTNPLTVLVDDCPEVAPTSVVDTTNPGEPSTLPFTGIDGTSGLALAGLGLLGFGALMLRGRHAE